MINIVICDDDSTFILYMKNMISDIMKEDSENIKFFEYNSGKELIEKLNRNLRCDLLILDMQMPYMDGDETARLFREQFPEAVLVFCSGEVEPTSKSFEAGAYRYIKKESPDEDIKRNIKKVMQKVKDNITDRVLIVENEEGEFALNIRDIAYAVIEKRGCLIYMKDTAEREVKTAKINMKLEKLHEELGHGRFALPHKSFVVNLDYVKALKESDVVLRNNERVPLSKWKAKEFKLAYARYKSKN